MNITSIIPNSRIDNLTPISEMKSAKGERESDWDFDVHQETLKTRRGCLTDIKAVVRTDTGQYIGQYKTLSLIKNKDLADAVEAQLDSLGIDYERKIRICGNGSRLIIEYRLGETLEIAGESYSIVCRLTNSYDGRWKVGLQFFVERKICLNGVTSSSKIYAVVKKHNPKVDAIKIAESIKEGLDNALEEGKSIEPMRDIALNDQQVLKVLSNISKLSKGKFPVRHATRVAYAWHTPTADERPLGDNMYRLLQAGTRTYRDLSTKRAEACITPRREFCESLVLAANPTISVYAQNALNELLAEPDKDYALTA